MVGATPGKFRPTAKRRRSAAVPVVAERCPKCERELNPARYHDCGEQLVMPIELPKPVTKGRNGR
jgi:hypothetical protein